MYKARSQDERNANEPTLSVCDVMRDNTNQVIMKVESLVPIFIEGFTDLQAEYLKIARDFFGTCYIAEKELCDKIGIDNRAIEGLDKYLKVLTKYSIAEIEIASNLQKMFVDNTMSAMRCYDDYIKLVLSSYAKILEYTLGVIPQKT